MGESRGTATRSTPRRVGALRRASTDWQAERLAQVRRLIRRAEPEVVEEPKWRKPTNPDGVPVWSKDGILFTGERYESHVRLTFAHGASLPDPDRVFNSGFRGHTYRAIVLREGDRIPVRAFLRLVRAAAAWNVAARGSR